MTSSTYAWGVRPVSADPWADRHGCHTTSVEVSNTYGVIRDPEVWGGTAMVSGTRIPVYMVEDMHEEGCTVQEIIECYPRLTPASVFSALAYAYTHRGLVDEERASHARAITALIGQ